MLSRRARLQGGGARIDVVIKVCGSSVSVRRRRGVYTAALLVAMLKSTQSLAVAAAQSAAETDSVRPQAAQLSARVESSGSFVILAGNEPQFSHSPKDAWLKCATCVAHVSDPASATVTGLAPVELREYRQYHGSDAIGNFTAHQWTWIYVMAFPADPVGCNPRRWIHTLYVYDFANTIRFTQKLPEGIQQEKMDEHENSGSSSWPALRPVNGRDFGAFLWQGDFTGNEAAQGGRWNSTTSLGAQAPSPIALFERGFTNGTFIYSPAGDSVSSMGSRLFSGQMNATQCKQPGCVHAIDSTIPVLNFGALSCTECVENDIGAGVQLEALLSYSPAPAGVNEAMYAFGETMMAGSGKSRNSRRDKDYTLRHLGYSTDAGAYYYYWTGTNDTSFFPDDPNRFATYEDVILALQSHATKEAIPVKYVLLDSYWYEKSTNGGGTKLWSPTPETFPRGLAWLHARTGFYWQLHNRYWSSDCDYATQNNGSYNFFIPGSNCSDPTGNLDVVDWQHKHCSRPGQFSLPQGNSTALFAALMRNATRWGGVTYEQDWLDFESDEVVTRVPSIASGGAWMESLGRAAELTGLGVQLCMSHTRHVLAGARLTHITQTRASNDYKGVNSDQWDIGRSSLFADVLGIAPSKDSFWSSVALQQPPDGACCGVPCGRCGGPSTGRRDFYSRLNSAISTLSTGPVTYSDRIGSENRAAIMRSCTKNGTLLQPSRAATTIDASFHGMAFGMDGSTGSLSPPHGTIMATSSVIGQHEHGLVLAADLAKSYDLALSGLFWLGGKSARAQRYVVFESNVTRRSGTSQVQIVEVSGTTGIVVLPPSDKVNFTLHSLAPVTQSGWAMMGELTKWVPAASMRFKAVDSSSHDLVAEIEGSVGEVVEVSFFHATTRVLVTVDCTLGATETAHVSAARQTCE